MITYPIIRMVMGEGHELVFSGEQVISATLVEEVNPISVELPISTLDFVILSYDDTFSMFSGSYYNLLSQRLPITVHERLYDDTGLYEDRFLGKYYLEEWKNESEYEYSFKAIDSIGLLAATNYDGGFWSAPTPLETIIGVILSDSGVDYSIDASIRSRELKGWIPSGDCRKALQQVCFAARAMASSTRNDYLSIVPIPLITSPIIIGELDEVISLGDEQKLIAQTVELQPTVTSIELISHEYSQGTELEDVFDEWLEAGSHKIIFSKPYYEVIVDGPGYTPSALGTEGGDYIVTEGGDYIEVGGEYLFGPNALYLELLEGGQVTVTGYPWVDSKKSFTFRETGEFIHKNDLVISDATMVSSGIAQNVLDRARDYYRQLYTQNIKLLPSKVKPGLLVTSTTLFNKVLFAAVQKTSVDLSGGFITDTDIRGLELIIIWAVRKPRTGVAVTGASITRQDGFRS